MEKQKDIIHERIEYWLDLANYDLDTAFAMQDAERFLYVGFLSHQVIEKGLKALHWKKTESEPPFTHNLIILIQKCGVIDEVPEGFLKISEELMPLGISARYPDDKDMLLDILTREKCNEILSTVKDFLLWIKNYLKN
ncbi:MAG: HEPN domain-containing protein [Brevinematales bacterium]|nr:HEPN domain-containing protein [Brevinematales bacterium]